MQVFMVRHAHAGQRNHDGRDIYRPLSENGRQRADELIEVFAGQPVDRFLSSPATRCVQTLDPLALARGMVVEECQELWEGSSIAEALSVLEAADVENVVACSHGDIIPALIDTLNGQGVTVSGRGCELGSVWVLDFEHGRWQTARYAGSDRALA
jgi:8-oxo-dGTP diphosphatase